MTMQSIPGLSSIIDRYDALLLDLWGVIHDGTNLYPGVKEALVALRSANKKIIFLSNAPRRIRKVEIVLNRLGVEPGLYDHVVSSGEVGYQWLAHTSPSPCRGKKFYYIGPDHNVNWTDADVLDGLDYHRTDDIKSADFLLNVGFGTEEQSSADLQPLLRAALEHKLPMLCLNPDMEVVKISGERYPCAGVLAFDYEKLGGKVTYFGKPYPEVYDTCMQWLFPLEKPRILAVGDGIATDIKGAVRFGLDCVLVTCGLLQKNSESVAALCEKHNAVPNYIIPAFQF